MKHWQANVWCSQNSKKFAKSGKLARRRRNSNARSRRLRVPAVLPLFPKPTPRPALRPIRARLFNFHPFPTPLGTSLAHRFQTNTSKAKHQLLPCNICKVTAMASQIWTTTPATQLRLTGLQTICIATNVIIPSLIPID